MGHPDGSSHSSPGSTFQVGTPAPHGSRESPTMLAAELSPSYHRVTST